jgi:hypothetical protein
VNVEESYNKIKIMIPDINPTNIVITIVAKIESRASDLLLVENYI